MRVPMTLNELVHWKASENKNLLLLLGHCNSQRYIVNTLYFACLAKDIFLLILLQDAIEPTNLVIAET